MASTKLGRASLVISLNFQHGVQGSCARGKLLTLGVGSTESTGKTKFKISKQMVHAVFQEDVLLFSLQSGSSGMLKRRPHLYTALGSDGDGCSLLSEKARFTKGQELCKAMCFTHILKSVNSVSYAAWCF